MKKLVLREIISGCLCTSLSSVHGQTNADTRQHKNSSNFQMATFSYVCQLSLISIRKQIKSFSVTVIYRQKVTGQVESLHATNHYKHEAGTHVIDYARGFGNTAKEGLKRTTRWAAHYFTNKKSYCPVPSNSISFWDIPFLPPLPVFRWTMRTKNA